MSDHRHARTGHDPQGGYLAGYYSRATPQSESVVDPLAAYRAAGEPGRGGDDANLPDWFAPPPAQQSEAPPDPAGAGAPPEQDDTRAWPALLLGGVLAVVLGFGGYAFVALPDRAADDTSPPDATPAAPAPPDDAPPAGGTAEDATGTEDGSEGGESATPDGPGLPTSIAGDPLPGLPPEALAELLDVLLEDPQPALPAGGDGPAAPADPWDSAHGEIAELLRLLREQAQEG